MLLQNTGAGLFQGRESGLTGYVSEDGGEVCVSHPAAFA